MERSASSIRWNKKSVHLRVDPEVLDFFKSEGKGHLTRMNAVLRSYVRNHRRLLRDPAHAAGMVVLRAVEAGGYAAGARRGRREWAGR